MNPATENPLGAIPLEFDLDRYAFCGERKLYRLYSILIYQPQIVSQPYRLHYWHGEEFKFIAGLQKGVLSAHPSILFPWKGELNNLQGQFVIFKLDGPLWNKDID